MTEDIRTLSKWLNEESTAPIDRQALARVLALAQQAPVAFGLPIHNLRTMANGLRAVEVVNKRFIAARLDEISDYLRDLERANPPAPPAPAPVDELVKALQLIADTDPVDAALDPQRAVRVARAALQSTAPQTKGQP